MCALLAPLPGPAMTPVTTTVESKDPSIVNSLLMGWAVLNLEGGWWRVSMWNADGTVTLVPYDGDVQ